MTASKVVAFYDKFNKTLWKFKRCKKCKHMTCNNRYCYICIYSQHTLNMFEKRRKND